MKKTECLFKSLISFRCAFIWYNFICLVFLDFFRRCALNNFKTDLHLEVCFLYMVKALIKYQNTVNNRIKAVIK